MIALPENFARVSLTALPPSERAALLRVLDEGAASRGLRLRSGAPLAEVESALPGIYAPVPWAKDGYCIDADSRAGAHPLHAAGAYYLQEPSAMAAAPLLDVRPGMRVLDLCAAPGGKSTQIAALLRGEGVLVANEMNPSRAKILSHNIERMGVPNAIVTNEPPDRLAGRWGAWFDRILVDAPCSGEGMFRREPESRREWTEEAPAGCAARQRQILASAAQMLRPGGRMVYSTCTFNEIENEGVAEWFVREHPAFSLVDMKRIWPNRDMGEGHFVAALTKAGEPGAVLPQAREQIPLGTLLPGFDGVCVPGLLYQAGRRYWALPVEMPPLSGLRALRTGLALAETVGKVTVPDHALALAMPPCAFPRTMAVDEALAARYLRGVPLPAEGLEKGWTAVSIRGFGLGWAKCADGVLKNHLPKGLRIH